MEHEQSAVLFCQTAKPDAQAIADRLEVLYVNHYDRFVMMRPDGAIYIPKVGDRTMVLAKSNLVKHAKCEYAVSVFAGKEGSKFVCFDVDQGGKERARQVVNALEQLGVPGEMIHVSFSGGKGYHVEVFFSTAVRTKHLLRLYKQVMHMICAASHEVEFRPLNKMAIKLPLSCHHRTGNRCWFVDRSSFEQIKSTDYLFRIEQMQADAFLEVAKRIPAETELPSKVRRSISDADTDVTQFDVGRIFAPLSEPGTRHQRMVRIAVYLRHHGADVTACTEALISWYEQQSDEFIKSSEQEVMREIRGVVKPLWGVCDTGDGGEADERPRLFNRHAHSAEGRKD